MHDRTIIDPSIISAIVHCIEEATGNDIVEDIRHAELQGTRNSVPFRIWDLITRNIIRELGGSECLIKLIKAGPWQMLLIYEPVSNHIITFMREKRYKELKRRLDYRTRAHYLDVFARCLNKELRADADQMSFFSHSFENENRLGQLLDSMLGDLSGADDKPIGNHILVLFETVGETLVSVRAVKVTPSLEIASGCEWDWSKYISGNTRAVTQTVTSEDDLHNRPTQGISLTEKALAKKKNLPQMKETAGEQRNRG